MKSLSLKSIGPKSEAMTSTGPQSTGLTLKPYTAPPPPAFTPQSLPGLLGWYDATRFDTLTLGPGNVVQQVDNLVPGGFPLRELTGALGDGGPIYDPNGAGAGIPALTWPYEKNRKGMGVYHPQAGFVNADIAHLFIVAQFQDGVTSVFDENTVIIGDLQSITAESGYGLIGRKGQSIIFWRNDINYSGMSINGGPFDITFLPMPVSVLHISAADSVKVPQPTIPVCNFGGQYANYEIAWGGLVCEVVAYDSPLTPEQVAEVEAYLTEKWPVAI